MIVTDKYFSNCPKNWRHLYTNLITGQRQLICVYCGERNPRVKGKEEPLQQKDTQIAFLQKREVQLLQHNKDLVNIITKKSWEHLNKANSSVSSEHPNGRTQMGTSKPRKVKK